MIKNCDSAKYPEIPCLPIIVRVSPGMGLVVATWGTLLGFGDSVVVVKIVSTPPPRQTNNYISH